MRVYEQPSPLVFLGMAIGMFFFLFPVTFVPLGAPLAIAAYLVFLMLWARRPILIPVAALPTRVISTLFLLALYSAMVTSITGMNDLTFAVQMAKVGVLYVGTGVIIGIVCISMRTTNPFDLIIRAFVICCLVQSIFISISIFSVQFRTLLDSLIVATGNTNYLESFRVRGFSSSGGASLSLNQALGVLSSLYMLNRTKKIFYLYAALIIWIPTFFVARTGFYLGASFLILNFLSINRITGVFRRIFFNPMGILGFSAISLAVFLFASNLLGLFDDDTLIRLEQAVSWGTEIFQNIGQGSIETESTNALLDMLVVPSEPYFFIFGFGVFDSGAFGYERTDSGYLKSLYSSGIVGVLFLYGMIFSALLGTAFQYGQRDFFTYMIILTVVFSIVEFKEPFLYQNYSARYAFILLGAGAVINWKERSLRNELNKLNRYQNVMNLYGKRKIV